MFKGKLNRFRTYAMLLMFVGMIIMYISITMSNPIVMSILMVLGFLIVIASAVGYFLIGMLTTRAVMIECPTCHKATKMLGKNDECMFCKQKLTLDPNNATASE